MKMRTPILLYFILFFSNHIVGEKALVIVPVANLVGSPITKTEVFVDYKNMPAASGKKNRNKLCPRLHQVIFNEIVDITDEQSQEVRINISNVYFITQNNLQPQTAYWTHKKNLIPFSKLEQKGVDITKIPKPIQFTAKNIFENDQQVITLIAPWTDSKTGLNFSVGTRFVLYKTQNNHSSYFVYLFDPGLMDFRIAKIPKNIALKNSEKTSYHKRISQFVNLLKKWANPHNGIIPYVWGGCSFISTYHTTFEKKNYDKQHPGTYYFTYNKAQLPCAGFDCSGIIARAAQTVGLPYFFQNI